MSKTIGRLLIVAGVVFLGCAAYFLRKAHEVEYMAGLMLPALLCFLLGLLLRRTKTEAPPLALQFVKQEKRLSHVVHHQLILGKNEISLHISSDPVSEKPFQIPTRSGLVHGIRLTKRAERWNTVNAKIMATSERMYQVYVVSSFMRADSPDVKQFLEALNSWRMSEQVGSSTSQGESRQDHRSSIENQHCGRYIKIEGL